MLSFDDTQLGIGVYNTYYISIFLAGMAEGSRFEEIVKRLTLHYKKLSFK